MVKVPLYQENQDRVALRPEYTETLAGGATADAFGSAIGQGLQSVASGMNVAAQAMQRVQQMKDDAVVSDGTNQWLQTKDKLLYDPDTGYANTQGRQAIDQFDAYQKSVQGLKRDIVAKMSPVQTDLFNKQIGAYEADALRSGYIKKAEETKKWLLQEHASAAETFSQQAIQSPDDEERWNGFVGRGLQEIEARGAKEGWGEQRSQLERQSYVSNARLQSALRIAESDPIRAAKYTTDHGSEISPQDHMVLLDKLKPDLKTAAAADAAHFNASHPVPGQFAAQGLSHDQYALLSVISGTESPAYDMMNGGQRIDDYAAHPGFIGAAGTTTAAGRYQFVKGTWDRAATALGLTDFSPASQDRAAAWLAQVDYRTNTGRELARDIADGNYDTVRLGLKTTWEGLAKVSDAEFAKRMGAARSAPLAVASNAPSGNAGRDLAAPASQPAGPQFSQPMESVLSSLPPAYADEIRQGAADGARAQALQQASRAKAAQVAQTDAYRQRIADGDAALTVRDIDADTVIDGSDKATLINALDKKSKDALETSANVEAFHAGKLVIDPYSDKGRDANDAVWDAISSVVEPSQVEPLLFEQIRQTGAVPTPVGNNMRLKLTRGKLDGVREALDLGNRISLVDAGALARMTDGTELADDVLLYSHYVNTIGLTPDEAAQRIIDRKNPDQVRRRAALMDVPGLKDEIDKLASYSAVSKVFDRGPFSWDDPFVGDNYRQGMEIVSDYKDVLTESIFDAGSTAGVTLANARFKRRYGFSEFTLNGPNAVTYLPPEKTYPADVTGSYLYIREQLNAFLAADGIKHGDASLLADQDTEHDVAAGNRPARYQVYYKDENGVVQHYRKPFAAEPPSPEQVEAAKKVADEKLAKLLKDRGEQEQYRMQLNKLLALTQATTTPPPPPPKTAPSSPGATPAFSDVGPLRKTKREN